MSEKLKYVSEKIAENLEQSVEDNLLRYTEGDFLDLEENGGWSIPLNLTVDMGLLKNLEGTSGVDAEVKNSLIVWEALPSMTPSLACENRIWVRLTHIECLEYSRKRWIEGLPEDKIVKSIRAHFFANGRTQCRDDNAISRLWWNAYIAKRMAPDNQKEVLNFILKKADRRLNFIERPRLTSRPPVSSAVARLMMKEEEWMDVQKNFRGFMKELNKYGGGVLFEAMSTDEADSFMKNCMSKAKAA